MFLFNTCSHGFIVSHILLLFPLSSEILFYFSDLVDENFTSPGFRAHSRRIYVLFCQVVMVRDDSFPTEPLTWGFLRCPSWENLPSQTHVKTHSLRGLFLHQFDEEAEKEVFDISSEIFSVFSFMQFEAFRNWALGKVSLSIQSKKPADLASCPGWYR